MGEPVIPIAYGVPMAPPESLFSSTATATAPSTGTTTYGTATAGGRGGGGGGGRPSLLQSVRGSSRVLLSQSQNSVSDSVIASALTAQGYSRGLVQALQMNKQAFALAFWIIDNSGSMQTRDGHRIVEQSRGASTTAALKFADCTRWAEMQQMVDYHATLAALLQAPTVFRMLNDPGRLAGPQQFSIANDGIGNIDHELAVATAVMQNSQPGGVTPLTMHIQEIRDNILQLEPQLRATGQKVAIVLATDGLPTDAQGYSNSTVKEQFAHALRALEGLPVWIVVRLCTDESSVVEYWNNLDAQLELSLEVLDDFVGEAQEVHECNKWLNYGLPLHRMREMGFHHTLFDLLDERSLTKDEVRDFCKILFGRGLMDEAADPQADWKSFAKTVTRLLASEAKQWNPVTKRVEPWIDMKKLNAQYGSGFFGLW